MQRQEEEEGERNPEVEVEERPSANLLMDLRPPPLEEAGLEDCALPADSILRAFSIAAKSVATRSIAVEEDRETRGCVDDPAESFEEEVVAVTAEEGIQSEGDGLCGKAVAKCGAVTAGKEGGIDERCVERGEGRGDIGRGVEMKV